MSKVKLTEICNITTGKLDSNAAEDNGRYPYFTCAPEPLAINTYAFDDDVILLAGNNASGNFHCQRYKGKFNAYQRTYVITAKDGYDIDYIYYNLKINLAHLKKIAQGSQTKFLTMQILDGFELEDIDLKEQRRLSKILSTIDKKIELNNKINTELEDMAKTLYDYWFLQFEFPHEEGKPYKSSGGKMVWNEELKREIPEGWEIGNLYDIADFINGLACQKYRPVNDTEKLPVIKITEMHDGITDNTEFVRSDIPENNIINDGDILFSWSGTLCMNIWCGGKAGLNQHIFKVTSDKYPKWFYYFWTLKHLNNFVEIAAGKATTMGHIKRTELDKSIVKIPSNKSLEEADKIFTPLFNKYINNNIENKNLIQLRDTLLPKLMNGEIDLENIEI